ncbi:MAG: molybdenum cofactor guanylyltransferase, partial [Candidatus Bipolaricaulia bacterium]
MSNLSGILLCGGRAARMGRDKGLIEWEGEPLIARLAKLLQGLFQEVLVVTGRERRYQDLLDLPILEDRIKGAGPLGGIYTGLLHSSNDYTLVVACDMPLIRPELIELLAGEIDGSWAIVP